jgi:predicted CopG family antitoxin
MRVWLPTTLGKSLPRTSTGFSNFKFRDIHAFLYMATKNIAIREEVYKKLASAKNDNESFSDTIDRLLKRKTSLLSFAGVFSEDDDELKTIEKEVNNLRRRTLLKVSAADKKQARTSAYEMSTVTRRR